MTFRSRWSCDIQFHKYTVHINGDFDDKLHPQILAVDNTTNSPLRHIYLRISWILKMYDFFLNVNFNVICFRAIDVPMSTDTVYRECLVTHRCMGMDFISTSPLFSTTPPPFFSKFSYKSFLFQNFHNHSFFLHLTISVDIIDHE